MKILVLRFSSIGDIVLTTPIVRQLKTQLSGAEVHFATKPAYRSLLEANPYIDKTHVLSGSLISSWTCTAACARGSSACVCPACSAARLTS
jgi:ADP-heptose:LPS heptosyltransferase